MPLLLANLFSDSCFHSTFVKVLSDFALNMLLFLIFLFSCIAARKSNSEAKFQPIITSCSKPCTRGPPVDSVFLKNVNVTAKVKTIRDMVVFFGYGR